MRDADLQAALKVIDEPAILINVVSRRAKRLKRGTRSLVESLEKLAHEKIAPREIAEGKITYELAELAWIHGGPKSGSPHKAFFNAA